MDVTSWMWHRGRLSASGKIQGVREGNNTGTLLEHYWKTTGTQIGSYLGGKTKASGPVVDVTSWMWHRGRLSASGKKQGGIMGIMGKQGRASEREKSDDRCHANECRRGI